MQTATSIWFVAGKYQSYFFLDLPNKQNSNITTVPSTSVLESYR